MKRRYLFPIIILVITMLAAVTLPGCLGAPKAPAKPATPDLSTRVGDIEANKASKSEVYLKTESYNREEIDAKIAAGPSASVDAYPKTETYTRTEIDNLIASAVADLEKQIDDIDTGSSSSGSSSSGDYGELIDHDGDLELWLDSMEPASDPFKMSTGGDDVLFDIVIVNKDDRSHKFDLSIRLSPEDDVEVNPTTFDVDVRPDDFEMTGERTDWNTTQNDGSITISNDDYAWIGGDEADHYSINIYFSNAPMTYWDFKLFIEDRS